MVNEFEVYCAHGIWLLSQGIRGIGLGLGLALGLGLGLGLE
jgi:hypothetical protein